MLSLYRRGLDLRRRHLSHLPLTFEWLPSPDGVLALRRGDLTCVVNFTNGSVPLPDHRDLLLTSAEVVNGNLPSQAAAWLLLPPREEQSPAGTAMARPPHQTEEAHR